MKCLDLIYEDNERNNVIPLGGRTKLNTQNPSTTHNIELIKKISFREIDHLVAASIDKLTGVGMNNEEAYRTVVTHLSDLVMAFDLQGGSYD